MAGHSAPRVLAGIRPTDRDREQVIDRLQEAYVSGALDHAEFDRRIDAALATLDSRELTGLTGDLPGATSDLLAESPPRRRRKMSGRVRGGIAAVAAGLVLLGVTFVGLAGPELDSAASPYCLSTGLSSDELGCPDLTAEQVEIEERAAVAAEAAGEARNLVGDLPDGSDSAAAATAAEEAAARAQAAISDGQAIAAESLVDDPPEGAYDDALAEARKASKEALKALRDARAAVAEGR